MKLNLPNKLTLLRVILIPLFMFFIIFPVAGKIWSAVIAAVLFGLTSLTDMFDGRIARKYNLITDFGKFLDPLADKVMIIGGFVALLCRASERGNVFNKIFACVLFFIIFRELAVTSMRLVVAGSANVVIAADILGKIKTVSQIVSLLVLILEPAFYELVGLNDYCILSYVTLGFSLVMTVWSGINYFIAYWPYINTNK